MSIFDLSPWLQVPLILAAAVPVGGLLAWGLLRVIDWVAARTSNTSDAVDASM